MTYDILEKIIYDLGCWIKVEQIEHLTYHNAML